MIQVRGLIKVNQKPFVQSNIQSEGRPGLIIFGMVDHNIVDTNVPVDYFHFLNEILVSWLQVLAAG